MLFSTYIVDKMLPIRDENTHQTFFPTINSIGYDIMQLKKTVMFYYLLFLLFYYFLLW